MKTVAVNLQVQANIEKAQANIQQLSSLLRTISESKINLDAGPISEAASAAQQLQVHLNNAINANTGKLDLTKLSSSLSASNTNLFTLTTNLQKAGTQGQQAFLKIAQAVASAEAPMTRINAGLKNFGVTLLNTIKWQLASNLIHGVQGALSGAVSHAKELNSALSDIRIVTGYTSDQMANFASEAKEAASALNTTTIEYSKAALIFFQQGLKGDDVKERVETVTKLAQVTGQASEVISDQMTAVWNNFDDGSHKLEYYADVITKLGAATASSSAEITEGLGKFAAVADTVGLSYEKATASLATVVAETRQSPEVVGTAFKTMLARIEGLQLGETLEDGVDLNKYSEALAKVGVNVLDSNGKLREMDNILDDLGEKWKSIGEEQKVALSETVAGVRQYSQFMALMNNYGEVQKNEQLAKDSAGTLQQQADIWAESWEAASKRVDKNLQDLYESIINDQTLIKLEDVFGGIIKNINNFINAAGGIGPVFLSILGIASSTLFPLLQNGFKTISYNIKVWTGEAAHDFATMQGALSAQMDESLEKNNLLSNSERELIKIDQELINQKTLLTLQSKSMSEAEKLEAENKMQLLEITSNLAKAALERKAAAEGELETLEKLSSAEKRYQAAASKARYEMSEDASTQDRTVLQEATKRGNDISVTEDNIGMLKAQKKELVEPNTSDLQTQKQNLEQKLKNSASNMDISEISKIKEQIKEIEKEIEKETEAYKKQSEELDKQIQLEEDILAKQQELKKESRSVTDKTVLGTIDTTQSYYPEDQQDADTATLTNNIISNNSPAPVGDDTSTIGVTEEGFKKVVTAAAEARIAEEEFQEMSKELNVILSEQADALSKVDAKTLEIAQGLKEETTKLQNNADKITKNTNAKRLEVQTLKNKIAQLKQTPKHYKAVKEAKEKLKNAEKELVKAEKEEREAHEAASAKMKEFQAKTTPATQAIMSMRDKILKWAETLNITGPELENLKNKIDEALNNPNAEEKTRLLQEILSQLGIASGQAGEALENMAGDMEAILLKSGRSKEEVEQLIQALQTLVQSEHDVASAQDKRKQSMEDEKDAQGKVSKGLTTLGSLLGKTAMGYGALKAVVNVWSDKDASLMDKIMGTFTSMSMILPIISGQYGVLTLAKKALNFTDEEGNKITLKKHALQLISIAQEARETGATWLQVAAEVAKNIAKGPVGWAIAAASLAMIAATVVAITASTAATEKETKAIEEQNKVKTENAKNTVQAADKWQEEANKIDTLIKSYKDLKNAQKDVTDVQKDILDQAPDLIDSYKELNNTLKGTSVDLSDKIKEMENAVATGDIDRIVQLKKELDAEAARGTFEVTKKGARGAVGETKAKMKESGPNSWSNDDAVGFSSGGFDGHENDAANIIVQKMQGVGGKANKRVQEDIPFMGTRYNVDYQLDTREGHEAEFVQQYEALQEAKQEMLEQGVNENSDIYKDLNKMLEETKDQYEQTKELVGDTDNYQIEQLASKTDLTEIENYQEYNQMVQNLKDEMVKKGKSKEEAEEAVKEWAKGKDVLEDYVKMSEKLDSVQDKTNKKTRDEVEKYINDLQKTDPEKSKLLLKVDFSKVDSAEALEAQLDYLQTQADKEEIKTKVTAVSAIEGKLKNSNEMTSQDWSEIETQWDSKAMGGASFSDFQAMSDEERKDFVNDYKNKNNIDLLKQQQKNINEYQENVNNNVNKEENKEYLEKEQNEFKQTIDATLSQAKTLQELDVQLSQLEDQGVGVPSESLATALENLGAQYENTSKEAENYKNVLANLEVDKSTGKLTAESENALAVAEDQFRAAIKAGEAAKKYNLNAEVIEAQAKSISKLNKDLKISAEQATNLAIANQRMNAGVKTLHENFGNWKKTLQSAEKTSMDYAQATADVTSAMRDLLAVSDDWELPDGFLDAPEHLDQLERAAAGDETAINELGLACAKAGVEAAQMDETFAKAYKETFGEKLTKDFSKVSESVSKGIQSIQDNLSSLMNGTMSLDEAMGDSAESWVENLNKMALATGMSVDEMNDLLNQVGVTAKVDVKHVKQKMEIPTYEEHTVTKETNPGKKDKKTGEWLVHPSTVKKTWTVPGKPIKVTGYTDVAQISTVDNPKTPEINESAVEFTGVGGTADAGGVDRGGGVSDSSIADDNSDKKEKEEKESTTKAASHENVVNRYSDEENAVKGLSDQYNRLSAAKDRAYGINRIQAIDAEIKKVKELKNAHSNYLKAVAGSGNSRKIAEAINNGEDIGRMIASGKLGGTINKDYKALYSGRNASGHNVEFTTKDSKGNEKLSTANFSLRSFNNMFGSNIKFNLDEFGNIRNRDNILNQISHLSDLENDRYARIKDPTAAQSNEHNKRLAYLKELPNRISQYGETQAKLGEETNQYLEQIYKLQELNAEKITEKMNLRVELGQRTQKKLDRAIKLLGDNIYKSVEAMHTWFDKTFKEGLKTIKIQGNAYDKAYDKTMEKWERYQTYGKTDEKAITPAKAAELFKSIEDGAEGLIDTLLTKISAGHEFYGQVLETWKTKIQDVTASIESNAQTLSHLQNVLSLLGKSTDYDKMRTVLKGQLNVSTQQYNVKKTLADNAKDSYNNAEKKYQAMKLAGATEEELENYYNDVVKKAKDYYYETTAEAEASLEDMIQKASALHELNVQEILENSERNMTGEWASFEALDSAMQRQHSVAEQYLTKTNQLYETNKMLRTLQKDIDKTDSRLAKEKLKAFSDEIEALKEKGKLNKTELEIAKARYEVLQAQIALEEAQNAKSTVRLQRDNEGNYGYIYTADQDKVSDAEQTLADKENALYNIGLNNAQTYAEKLANIGKEYQAEIDKLREQKEQHKISEEEFQTQLLDIQQKYHDLELSYLESYNAANQVLNEVGAEGQTEAWTNSFKDIIANNRLFNDDMTGLGKDLADALIDEAKNWEDQVVYYEGLAGLSNEDYEQTVKDVKTTVGELTKELIGKDGKGGLAASMKSLADEADKSTRVFLKKYLPALEKLVSTYSELADKANEAYEAVSTYDENKDNKKKKKSSDGKNSDSDTNGNGKGADSDTNGNEKDSDGKGTGKNKYSREEYLDYTFSGNGSERKYYIGGKHVGTGSDDNIYTKVIQALINAGIWGKNYGKDSWTVYYPKSKDEVFKSFGLKTGGYTGSWSGIDSEDNGKLAFLHQKELVLNATDTGNILEAVKLIREISQNIDLQVATQSRALQVQAAQFSGEGQILEQEVTIHAEFPNAVDHNEIEEAFNNLVNQASQYANRK